MGAGFGDSGLLEAAVSGASTLTTRFNTEWALEFQGERTPQGSQRLGLLAVMNTALSLPFHLLESV